MRRILALLTGLVLFGSVVGCHIAGRCDCTDYSPCAGACCLGGDQPAPGQVIKVEQLKSMPKGGAADKE